MEWKRRRGRSRGMVLGMLGMAAMLTAMAVVAPQTSAAKGDDSGSGAYGYVWVDAVGGSSFFDYEVGSTTLRPGSNLASTVSLPTNFDFTLYGNTYDAGDSMYVAEDGFVTFTNNLGTTPYAPQEIPDTTAANNLIALFWSQQREDSFCAVYVGAAPQPTGTSHLIQWDHVTTGRHPRVIVSYDGVPERLGVTPECTDWNAYSAALFDGTDILELHYKYADYILGDPSTPARACHPVSLGIEDSAGSKGLLVDAVTVDPATSACVGSIEYNNVAYRIWKNDETDAWDQQVVTDEGEAVSFQLAVSDDPLVYDAATNPTKGSVSGYPTGMLYAPPEITYTPTSTDYGNYTLEYEVEDGYDLAQKATTTFVVNDVPVTEDDSYSFSTGTHYLAVLDNDEDNFYSKHDAWENYTAAKTELKVVSVATPSSGTATIEANGTIMYVGSTPGTVTFEYTASDGRKKVNGTVTVEVTEPPALPAGSKIVDQDSATVLLGALTGATGSGLKVKDVDGFELGTAVPTPDKMDIMYTPLPGKYGTDEFTYNVTHGGYEAEVAYTVTVNALPTPGDDQYALDYDASATTFDVLANDIDPFWGTLSLQGVDAMPRGTATVVDGKIEYTPLSGFSGTDSFTYTVHDTRVEAKATVLVHVNAPPEAADDVFSVKKGSVEEPLDVLANDVDDFYSDWSGVGGPVNLTLPELRILAVDAGAKGDVFTDGRFIYYTPEFGSDGSDVITYTVSDGLETATAELKVNILPGIDLRVKPIVVEEGGTSWLTDQELLVADGQSADNELRFTLKKVPQHGEILLAGAALTDQGFTQAQLLAGNVAYEHDGGEEPTDVFEVTLTNRTGAMWNITLRVQVLPIDDLPQATTGTITVPVDVERPIDDQHIKIVDVDSPLGAISIKPMLSAPLVEFRVDGIAVDTFTYDALLDGRVSVYGVEEDERRIPLRILADGAEVFSEIFIWVGPANQAPFLTGTGFLTVDWGRTVTIDDASFGWDDDYDDKQSRPTGIVLILAQAPLYGDLLKGGVPLRAGESFSQHDIQLGLITYRHGGNGPDADLVGVIVTDTTAFYPGTRFDIGALNIAIRLPEASGTVDGDNDGIPNRNDGCPTVGDADFVDLDGDGLSGACDPDDGFQIPPAAANAGPAAPVEPEEDEAPGLEFTIQDLDGDGLLDNVDNCPQVQNVDQADLDQDLVGDRCDEDVDGDGIRETGVRFPDNCPRTANPAQEDRDGDGVGDACSKHGEEAPLRGTCRDCGGTREPAHSGSVDTAQRSGLPPLAIGLGTLLMVLVCLGLTVWAVKRGLQR